MSGGVDSSVAAYLTKEKGYDCIGITMKLFENEDACQLPEKACCSADDVEDARKVASELGIPYYVFNFTDDFREKVIKKFALSYENGMTPNPCIDCNRYLKFERLYRRGMELGCDCVVTGHYARIEERDGRFLLKKAADPDKDQGYVLYSLTQDQLAHVMFPLGEMTKPRTRALAESMGFRNAQKKESQDICFVPDGDYAGVIQNFTGRTYPEGNFVDTEGNVLGRHRGIIRYTIGQRKGLGLALKQPMYVCRKDLARNEVVLCTGEELFTRKFEVKDFNWIAYDEPPEELHASVKIRYRQKEQPAVIKPAGQDRVIIEFLEPQRAITPGQAAVIYDGEIVVGGGTIV